MQKTKDSTTKYTVDKIINISKESAKNINKLTIEGDRKNTSLEKVDLSKFINLEELKIENMTLKEQDISKINSIKTLKKLALVLSNISDKAFKELSKNKNIESLYIANCPISANALKHIASMSNIKKLTLTAN